MSISLAVKYRPKDFESVCSQSSIIKILRKQLETKQFKNAYLFCGSSGCGKTTIARIFAEAINQQHGSPIEIDGASNNGVENVKQIIKAASERSLDSQYKVYIIDECHALTNQAWQAFLKCIEEPPTYTIFIFCTTDPQKIPATILNRVQRFNFNRISSDVICNRLKYICECEGFSDYSESCEYISRICGGQMRDAIALVDKCSSYDTNLCLTNVMSALGTYSYDKFYEIINNLIDCNSSNVIQLIQGMYDSGCDMKLFVDQFLSFCLDINKYAICNSITVTKFPASYESTIKNCINFENSMSYYSYIVDKLLDLKNLLKSDNDPKSAVEIYFMQICRCQ